MTRKLHVIAAGLVLGYAVAVSGALAQESVFGDKLGFMPRADANAPLVNGTGWVAATLDGNTLNIEGEFEGTAGSATALALHMAPPAQVGPEFARVDLEGSNSGTISATVDLTEEQVAALQDNSIYVVVVTDRNQTGELRAWLVADNDPRQ